VVVVVIASGLVLLVGAPPTSVLCQTKGSHLSVSNQSFHEAASGLTAWEMKVTNISGRRLSSVSAGQAPVWEPSMGSPLATDVEIMDSGGSSLVSLAPGQEFVLNIKVPASGSVSSGRQYRTSFALQFYDGTFSREVDFACVGKLLGSAAVTPPVSDLDSDGIPDATDQCDTGPLSGPCVPAYFCSSNNSVSNQCTLDTSGGLQNGCKIISQLPACGGVNSCNVLTGQCNPPSSSCGNPSGTITPPEQCDGGNLNGQTCTSLVDPQSQGVGNSNYTGGTLSCVSCNFWTLQCTRCGDGSCNGNETTANCPVSSGGDCQASTAGLGQACGGATGCQSGLQCVGGVCHPGCYPDNCGSGVQCVSDSDCSDATAYFCYNGTCSNLSDLGEQCSGPGSPGADGVICGSDGSYHADCSPDPVIDGGGCNVGQPCVAGSSDCIGGSTCQQSVPGTGQGGGVCTDTN